MRLSRRFEPFTSARLGGRRSLGVELRKKKTNHDGSSSHAPRRSFRSSSSRRLKIFRPAAVVVPRAENSIDPSPPRSMTQPPSRTISAHFEASVHTIWGPRRGIDVFSGGGARGMWRLRLCLRLFCCSTPLQASGGLLKFYTKKEKGLRQVVEADAPNGRWPTACSQDIHLVLECACRWWVVSPMWTSFPPSPPFLLELLLGSRAWGVRGPKPQQPGLPANTRGLFDPIYSCAAAIEGCLQDSLTNFVLALAGPTWSLSFMKTPNVQTPPPPSDPRASPPNTDTHTGCCRAGGRQKQPPPFAGASQASQAQRRSIELTELTGGFPT
jgi:hypothetical protein